MIMHTDLLPTPPAGLDRIEKPAWHGFSDKISHLTKHNLQHDVKTIGRHMAITVEALKITAFEDSVEWNKESHAVGTLIHGASSRAGCLKCAWILALLGSNITYLICTRYVRIHNFFVVERD